mmetsp:Transcript_41846/g.110843  ORF Transcript_41846/g.110843 Transcript_41846/m.110843 type:complete len:255 (+) Transcript_41846:138-902(+)
MHRRSVLGGCRQGQAMYVIRAARQDSNRSATGNDILPCCRPSVSRVLQVLRGTEAHHNVKRPPEIHWLREETQSAGQPLAQESNLRRVIKGVRSEQARAIEEFGSTTSAPTHVGDVPVPWQGAEQRTPEGLLRLPFMERLSTQYFHGGQRKPVNRTLLQRRQRWARTLWEDEVKPVGNLSSGVARLCSLVHANTESCSLRGGPLFPSMAKLKEWRMPIFHDGLHCPQVFVDSANNLVEPSASSSSQESFGSLVK